LLHRTLDAAARRIKRGDVAGQSRRGDRRRGVRRGPLGPVQDDGGSAV